MSGLSHSFSHATKSTIDGRLKMNGVPDRTSYELQMPADLSPWLRTGWAQPRAEG
jgi:hypothetical protein